MDLFIAAKSGHRMKVFTSAFWRKSVSRKKFGFKCPLSHPILAFKRKSWWIGRSSERESQWGFFFGRPLCNRHISVPNQYWFDCLQLIGSSRRGRYWKDFNFDHRYTSLCSWILGNLKISSMNNWDNWGSKEGCRSFGSPSAAISDTLLWKH